MRPAPNSGDAWFRVPGTPYLILASRTLEAVTDSCLGFPLLVVSEDGSLGTRRCSLHSSTLIVVPQSTGGLHQAIGGAHRRYT
jgi:hypothetical protein